MAPGVWDCVLRRDRQGVIRMAVPRRRRGVSPPWNPLRHQTKVTGVGKKRNVPSGKSYWAIFGTQPFWGPDPPLPPV